MKTVASTILTGTSLVLLALVPTPAAAGGGQSHTIVVTHEPQPLPAWRDQVSRELSGHLRYPRAFGAAVQESGFVTVRFRCGEDGQPVDVAVARRSSSSGLNRAALLAVSRLRSLHPLPEGLARGQAFQANVVFATSQASLERQIALLRQAETARLAAGNKAEREVLALQLVSLTPG